MRQEAGARGSGCSLMGRLVRALVMFVRAALTCYIGGPGHAVIASYAAALLVAGGGGISYPLAVAEELMRDASYGASRVRSISLVWSVQDVCTCTQADPMISPLTSLSPSQLHLTLCCPRSLGSYACLASQECSCAYNSSIPAPQVHRARRSPRPRASSRKGCPCAEGGRPSRASSRAWSTGR